MSTPTPLRVLLATNRPETGDLVEAELRRGGYAPQITRIATGEEFAAELRADLDVVLAGEVTGLRLRRALEMVRERHLTVPVIAMVPSQSLDGECVELIGQGAVDCCARENVSELPRAVARALRYRLLLDEKRQAELALRMSEERYRVISELASDYAYSLVVGADGQLRVEWMVGAFTRITGYTPAEVNEQGWLAYIRPEDRPTALRRVRTLMAGGSSEIELQIITKSGEARWIRDHARPVWNQAEGRVVRIYGAAQDITWRKRTEQGLKIRAYQQAAMSQLGQLALSGVDLDILMDETATQVAQTLELELSSIQELMADGETLRLRSGVGWKEGIVGRFTVPVGRETVAGYTLLLKEPVILEGLGESGQFGRDALLAQHGVQCGMSVIIYGRNERFGVLGVFTRSKRNFSQDDLHFLQAVANIVAQAVERKRAEEALQQSEARYRNLFQNANDIIYTCDLEGYITDINKAGERATGYTHAEAVNMNMSELIAPGWRDVARDMLGRKLAGESSTVYEIEIQTKDGRNVPVEITTQLIMQDDKPVGVQGIARDISERKQAGERVGFLLDVAKDVSSTVQLMELLDRVQRRATRVLPCNAVLTFYFDGSHDQFRMISQYGIPAEVLPADGRLEFPLGRVFDDQLRGGASVVINDASREPRLPAAFRSPIHIATLVAAPLRVRGHYLGALVALNAHGGAPFNQDQIELVEGIARELAVAIEGADL